MLRNTETGYGWPARLFHWLAFVLLILLTLKGLSFEAMAKGPEKFAQLGHHKSVGVLFLMLIAMRWLWRNFNTKPRPLEPSPRLRQLSALVSKLLYLLLLVQPLSGLLMSQAKGKETVLFEALQLPMLVPQSEALASGFGWLHQTVWLLIAGLVCVHLLTALRQHFIVKNEALLRIFVQR